MDNKRHILLAVLLVFLATLSRLVPHAWNFTPVTGILLFSTFAFRGYFRLLIPLLAILVSDIVLEVQKGIGFHEGTWIIYLTYLLIFMTGWYATKRAGYLKMAAVSLLSSVLFFLITNFALFYPEITVEGQLQGYPHTLEGITGAYIAGIPFFRNMLVGDLVWTLSLFSVFSFVSHRFLKPQLSN